MAKASLNMMSVQKAAINFHSSSLTYCLLFRTRTSAQDYRECGIFMNCVDTGWINDENPAEKAARIAADHNFQTPIDEIDAAARVIE